MIHLPKWRVWGIFVTCIVGLVIALPNFLSSEARESLPHWFPKQTVTLGLDLQGGSHLLLEVDLKAAMKDKLEALLENTRKILRTEKIGYSNLSIADDKVKFTLRESFQKEQAIKLFQKPQSELDVVYDDNSKEVSLSFSPHALNDRKAKIVEQSIEIVRRRIDEVGTKEPNIQRQGDDRILVQLPGIEDPGYIKNLLGQTAKMSFRLLNSEVPYAPMLNGGPAPAGSEILPGDEKSREGNKTLYVVQKKILVGGDNLEDASVSFDEYNRPQVNFKFDTVGGRKFGEITQQNIGQHLAIVLDKKVISAPTIQSAITGGSGVITGQFSVQEANDLALLMRAGALPAPLTVIEERTVGPDLGADSINAGQHATIIGVLFIIVFMVLGYSLFGFIADVALIFNLVFLFAALSLMGATLTLPGIAGIALTLGMAVDANVLIFERTKEEMRMGRKLASAIDSGFRHAMSTIIDSNVTTLFAAAALYFFGTGPIRGFGVTLAVGIAISMFTAISLTRMLIVLWFNIFKPTKLPI